MKPAFLIPVYNHGDTLEQVVLALQPYGLTCLIVDDGSDNETKSFIDDIIAKFDWVKSISLPQNSGKGAAILAGFAWLLACGYTHALQVDADNQHNLEDIPKFLQMAYDMPYSLISGAPIYDQSIPKSRLHGRKITNFWVAIETWSKRLTESMCGFRVYPLQALQPILLKIRGMRMDFDIEILIKAYWQGVDVNYIPTKVIYPIGGRSHFRLWRDNLRISWLHTRLFFGMFYHMPRHYFKSRKRKNRKIKKHA
ncbi:glycosyltransferase family 2 protein [Cysteiniphilum sp. 6C5]|uniref:glycosyltransferase family 2 protein n=1 Tax=unclassified Cysteiniphilum TaxID=2610889 RepID=UPI003F842D26